ncbi:MAG: lipid-A-disaccharide synthase [Candidatus Ratteibacteria bacterium]|nr:lipid-A-disaccharide synthase [Candidatus Ratteibacteria bacterium]
MKKKTIMLVAGEPSGDIHGANLIRNLKNLDNSLAFVGAGGKRMKREGLSGITDMEKLAVVGFKEVFEKFRDLKTAFRLLSEILTKERPDCLILIDYPGFNLRMAKLAKGQNIPVFYYISPQVWAWGKNRIKKIKKYVDKLFVILPFEEKFYSEYGIKAHFVGHPLLDIVKTNLNKEDAFSRFDFNPDKILIGILPGSRWKEVKLSMPVMINACNIISKEIPNVQFAVLISENIDTKRIEALLGKNLRYFKLIKDKSYDFMNICDLLLVNSGTATLEIAIMGKPMIIIYRLSVISSVLIRMLVKIPYFGLANIVAGKKIVPEFFQFEATPARIAKEALNILADETRIRTMQEELLEVKNKLGEKGASERTAKAILEEINQTVNNG